MVFYYWLLFLWCFQISPIVLISTLFFLQPNNISLCIHTSLSIYQLIDIRGYFWFFILLWIMLLWTFVYKFWYGHCFLFIIGTLLRVEFLGHTVIWVSKNCVLKLISFLTLFLTSNLCSSSPRLLKNKWLKPGTISSFFLYLTPLMMSSELRL